MNEFTIIGFIVISPFVLTLILIYTLVKLKVLEVDSQSDYMDKKEWEN